MIRLSDVVKEYESGTTALKGISLRIEDGEFVFLVGPSGSGKSTIIKLLTGEVTPMDEMIRHPGSVSAARLAGCKNFFAAEARDGKVYLPEWNVALPLAGMENTFTTIGIPDNAVTMSENGAMSCTVCRMILGVEENILLLRPEGSAEGAPMLRITVGHESDLQAGAAVRVALDYSKLLLL